MVDQYDPLALDYDPLAAGAYQHYIQLPTPQAPVDQAQLSAGPSPFNGGEISSAFVPFQDYAAMRGDENQAQVYDDYVNTVLPSYLSQSGLTPEQQALEIAEFRKALPGPGTYDRVTGAVDAAFSSVLPANSDKDKYIDQAGLQKYKDEQAIDNTKIEAMRKEFGTEDAGWLKRGFMAITSGLNTAFGSAEEFVGRNMGWKWLEDVGKGAKLEAAAQMRKDPNMYDKVLNAGGSVLAAIPVGLLAAEGGVAAGATVGVSRIAAAVASSGFESAGVAQEAYENALKNTGNADQAEWQAWKAFIANVPVSAIADKIAFFGKAGGGVVATLGKGAMSQGAEEGLQQLLTNYLGYEAKVGKGVTENAILGALVGGPISVVMHGGIHQDGGSQEDSQPKTNTGGREETTPAEAEQKDAARGELSPNDILNRYGDKPETATASDTQAQPQEVQNGSKETQPVRVQQEGQGNGQEAQNQGGQQGGRSTGQGQVQEATEQVQAVPQGQAQEVTGGRNAAPEVNQQGRVQEERSDGTQSRQATETSGGDSVQRTESIPTLPKELAGAKPRYAYQSTNYNLKFTNDVDRALFIVGRSKKLSNAGNDFMTWLQNEVFPNETENQIRGRGQVVVQSIRSLASSAPASSKTLTVPQYFKSSRSQPTVVSGGGEAAPAKRVAPTKPIPAIQLAPATTQAPARTLPSGKTVLQTLVQDVSHGALSPDTVAKLAATNPQMTPEFVEQHKQIADAFEALPVNALSDPVVKQAYTNLVEEVMQQYEGVLNTGVRVEAWKGRGEPYANSQEFFEDLTKNNHMYFFTTQAGFGEGADFTGHPLLQETQYTVPASDGTTHPMVANDVFRVVHDWIAHAAFENQFGPLGEEKAWMVHLASLNDSLAKWALTTETRGQNSWVNFGKHVRRENGTVAQRGDSDFIPLKDRQFADQKAALLPKEFVLTGIPEIDAKLDLNAYEATNQTEQEQTGAQVLDDLQVPDDPQLTAELAEESITRLTDGIESNPNASQAAAFVAAETESPTTGPITTAYSASEGGGNKQVRRSQHDQSTTPVKKRIGKPSPTVNTESANPGVEAVQPSVPGQPGGRVGDSSGSSVISEQSIAESRDEVLNPQEDTRIPVKDAELQRLSVELSTLPTDEAKHLANYLYNAFDVGFGQPSVERAKLMRARAMVAEAKQAYKLKKLGVRDNPEVIKLFTDPVTGEIFDSRVVRATFEQEPLGMGVKSFLEEGNLTGALQGLYLNGSTPLVRAVAGRLANLYLGDVKVKIGKLGKTNDGMQIGGQWSPSTLELRLDPVHGLNEHVLLHEAIHAATVQGIQNPKTAEQKAAVQELSALFAKAQKTLDPKQYAFTNLAEFVAETFANPDLQYQMYQIKEEGPSPSLWQRFINAVTKLVGLDTLLGRTMNVAEALFMAPVADGNIRGTFAATVAPQQNTGPIDITVKRTGKGYSWLFDREAAALNMGKQIDKALKALKITLPDAMNVRVQNVLKRSQAEAALRKWTEAHWNGITSSIQNVMKQHGRSVEEIEKFLEQLQVLGRAEQKIKEFDPTNSNYTEQVRKAQDALNEADKYLSDLEKNNPTYFQAMISVANQIKAGTDATLDSRMAARNNMTAARLASMKSAFPSRYMPNGFYIPLQLDNNDGTQVALMKQSLGQNFKAEQPLSRIYAQAALTAYANEANTEKQQILALATQFNLKDEFTGKPLIEIGPVIKLKRDPNTGEITEGQDNLLLDKDSIGVWVDGNYVKMRITDPALREALAPVAIKDMPQAIGIAIGAARHFTQLMSVARTSLNPGFAIFNFLRDQMAAAIQLDPKVRYGAYYAALLPALGSSFYNTFSGALGGKQSAKYLKALDDGAFISQRSYVGLTDTIRDVQQDLSPTLRGKLKAAVVDPFSTKVGQVLIGFSQSLETATRLAIYDAAIASGLSPKEAAYQAKTTTTNFERRSDFTNKVGPFYMFVNAKTQGTRTLIDKAVGIDANPRTQVALGSFVALGLIAAAIGYDKSDKDKDGISKYFKIADYKRDSRIIVKEGTPGIPLPQEASLFYVLGNAIGDVLMGPATVGQSVGRFVKNLIQQAAPLGAGQTDPTAKNTNIADYLMRLFLPSMAQPAYDLATNRDTFGRPVVPESLRFKGKADHDKYTRNENPTSIALAKAMYEGGYADVSPATLTYLAKYLEGGAVTFWKDMFNPKEPTYEGQNMNPIGRRFSSEAVPYGDTEAYQGAMDDLKRLFERGQSGSMAERGQFYNQNKEAIGLYNRFKAFETFKSRQLFRGYDKMNDDQLKRASAAARDRQMQLMRDYYKFKGIVKD